MRIICNQITIFMCKKLLNLLFTLLFVTAIGSVSSFAANGIVKMKTDAPAGTKLRIQTSPYDNTVEGADKGDFVGEFFSKGPGSEITITCNNLAQLEVYGCQLSEITIADAPELFILKCYNNNLTSLDVSMCPELAIIDCKNNRIASLDLSKCTTLEEAYVSTNNLSSFTLGTQPLLKTLECAENPLSTLDLSNCAALEDLRIDKCEFSSIDLSHCPELWWIFAFGNNFKGESMANFIAGLPEAKATGMLYIVDTADKDETNVCTMENVRAAAQKGWATMDYSGGKGSETQLGVFYPGCDYVPSVSDNTITLTTSRAAGETIKLNIKASDNIEISGIAETTNLTGSNTFTLTSQTVVVKGNVTSFECPGNDITSLSFDNPSLITYIDCRDNRIETLNLSGASSLQQLYAQKNSLTSLDMTGCDKMMRLDCYINNLHGSAMTAFMNSLCTSTSEPYLFVIDTKAPDGAEHNVASTTQVSIATGKGWKVFDYINGDRYGFGTAYAGSEPTEPEEYFTITRTAKGEIQPQFTLAVPQTEIPKVEGGEVLGWNGTTLTIRMEEETVKIYGDITGLQMMFGAIDAIDVSNLPNLTELNVALNDLTSLDVSKNKKLSILSCECNLLESLDLSQNPAIEYVNCYGNRIKGQAMTQMMESLPQRTREDYGTIIVYDESYAEEFNVCLTTDVTIALRKYWVPCELDADGNAIQYDGVAQDGIANVSGDSTKAVYDAANALIVASEATDITVYNLSGATVAKASNAVGLSVGDLPSGIYIVRAGSDVLKIKK